MKKLKEISITNSKNIKDNGEKDVIKRAVEYRVPCNYQCEESKLLRVCLLMKFPYLNDFEFDCYRLDNKNPEIYIKCNNKKSLYTPIQAFIDGDFTIITRRTHEYFSQYYNREDKKEFRDAEFATLDTTTAKKLEGYLENPNSYNAVKVEKKIALEKDLKVISRGSFNITHGKIQSDKISFAGFKTDDATDKPVSVVEIRCNESEDRLTIRFQDKTYMRNKLVIEELKSLLDELVQ